MKTISELTKNAKQLLKELISIPSVSKEENKTADLIAEFLKSHSKEVTRKSNNIWTISDNCDSDAPVILLNSHHDTVKPTEGWTNDPHQPIIMGDQLFGLGSNDAGASWYLFSVLSCFFLIYQNCPIGWY